MARDRHRPLQFGIFPTPAADALDEAIVAMGGPRRSRAQAAAALEEAIDVLRLLWSGERSVRYQGRHYQLDGAKPGPVPPHRIGIWLDVGMDTFVFGAAGDHVAQTQRFAAEVVPAVREAVDRLRR